MKTQPAPRNADCERLNRQYGAPGRIVFRPSNHDAPIVVLANQYGSAEVSLYGAQTISYRPTGNPPVLYMPHPYDETPVGQEIHGGIPVCWPWFARNGPEGATIHGLARYARWRVIGSEYSEDATEITLACASDDATRAAWPHDFALELKVTLSMKLTLVLRATNTGTDAFHVSEGFHPYFLVRDRDQTDVRGVDGCEFTDTNEPDIGPRTWTGDYEVRGGGSKIYTVTKREYVLMDHGLNRAIAIVSRGNSRLVVWNPGVESANRPEFGVDGWRKFVCVEPCSTPSDAGYDLQPGEHHDLVMAVQSVAKT